MKETKFPKALIHQGLRICLLGDIQDFANFAGAGK
jgi:hypothetical protein